MNCRFETITPVHVGTGMKYNKDEFIVKNGLLHRISIEKILDKLSDHEIEKFLSHLERKGFSIEDFLKDLDIRLSNITVYPVECQMIPNEIREQIKTGGVAYIPGSSIKGAIRSALLYWILKKNNWMIPVCYVNINDGERIGYDFINLLDLIKGNAQQFSNGRNVNIKPLFRDRKDNEQKHFGERFFNLIFGIKPFVLKGNIVNMNLDAKYDIFKFLQISDFMPVDVRLCAVNLKTHSLKNHQLKPKSYNTIIESLLGMFGGTISVSPQIYTAPENIDEYPLLRDKLKILGLEDDFHDEELIKHLKKVLRDYNQWCIEKEIELISSADNGGRFIEVLTQLKQLNNSNNLIRVGFGVGTMYQTLIKLIEEEDIELAEQIVNKFKLGKFKRRIDSRTGTKLTPPYPTSIEFTEDGKPLGWLKWM